MAAAPPVEQLCPSCGQPLSPSNLLGHCPRCLLAEITAGGGDPDPDAPPPSPTAPAGEQVTGHVLGRKLGEGGFAVVYEAEQLAPVRRAVALKILKSGSTGGHALARFEAERQALAILDHPAIATIYGAGETTLGRPYFAMELVEGQSVTEFCAGSSLPVRERLDLFLRICHGVQHAHQKGIIHRDLKPSNLLVTHFAEPKIIDFGIARATEEDLAGLTLVTHPAQMLGTPAYMAPEQAAMQTEAIDTRSDVYALGAILYELFCGSPPFADLSGDDSATVPFEETLRRIREDDPDRPSSRSPFRLPSDLDWIVLKCLRKRPADRYPSVAELVADLERHLDNQPVAARPPSLGYVARKFVRRHRALAAAVTAGGLALLAGTVTSSILHLRAARSAERAIANEARAVASEAREKSASSRSDFLAAGMLLEHGDAVAAVAHLVRALRHDPANEAARFKLLYLLASENFIQPALPPLMHDGIVGDVALSPDGRTAASAAYDGTVRLWDLADGSPRHVFQQRGLMLDVAFSPDGRRLAASGQFGEASLWDVESGRLLQRFQHDTIIRTLCFSPDGERILTASDDRTAIVWDCAGGQRVHVLELPSSQWVGALFSPDGARIVTRSNDQVRIWDAATGQPQGPAWKVGGAVTSLAISGDSARLAAGDGAGFARVWSLANGEPLCSPLAHGAGVSTVDLNHDGSQLATGTTTPDQSARLWNVADGSLVAPPMPYRSAVLQVRFTADGRRLVSVARSRTRFDPAIRLWDTTTGRPSSAPVSLPVGAKTLAVSADGQRLVTGSRDFAVRVWDIRSRKMLPRELHADSGNVWNVSFTDDGNSLTALSWGGRAHVWDAASGERRALSPDDALVAALRGPQHANLASGVRAPRLNLATRLIDAPHSGARPSITHFLPAPFARCELRGLAAAPDGETLATGCVHGTVRIWIVRERTLCREEVQLDSQIVRLVFEPTGLAAVVATRDGRIVRVPCADEPVAELYRADDAFATSLAFAPDRHTLVAGFSDGTTALWASSSSGASEPLRLDGHRGTVRHIDFTSDGTRLVTGSADRTAIVREFPSGRILHRLDGHIDNVPEWGLVVAVAPDDRTILTSGAHDATTRSWDLHTGAAVAPPMQSASGCVTLLTAPRSGFFATGTDDSFAARLWDPQSGEALTPVLPLSERSTALAFAPDERRFAAAGWDDIVRVWDLPPIDRELPAWLLEFAEAHVGLRLDSHGRHQPVPRHTLDRLRREILSRPVGDDPVLEWARWLATDPDHAKPISPWSNRPPSP